MVRKIRSTEIQVKQLKVDNQMKSKNLDELETQIHNLDKQLFTLSREKEKCNNKEDLRIKERRKELEYLLKKSKDQSDTKKKEREQHEQALNTCSKLIQDNQNLKAMIEQIKSSINKTKERIIKTRCNILESEEIKESNLQSQRELEQVNKDLSIEFSKQIITEKSLYIEAMNTEHIIHKIKGKLYSILVLNKAHDKLTFNTIELQNVCGEKIVFKFDSVIAGGMYEDITMQLYTCTVKTLKSNVELSSKIVDMYRKITGILKEVDENENLSAYKLKEEVQGLRNGYLSNLTNIHKESESVSKYTKGLFNPTDTLKPTVSVNKTIKRTSSISKSSSKVRHKRISSISSAIHQESEIINKGSNVREVTYIVVSLEDKFDIIRKYINNIIIRLEEIFGSASVNATISAVVITSNNEQKQIASNLLSLKEVIKNAIDCVNELINEGHILMKLMLKDYDKELRLVFVFLNSKGSLNRKCNLVKSGESIVEVLNNIRMGYLISVVDGCAEEICDLLEMTQVIEESVQCIKLRDV